MTARLGPVTSRRVSAGVHAPAGAASTRPAWWSVEDWIEEAAATVAGARDVCAEHHVDPDTVTAVARGMAAFADFRTGRDCRPTNARLREVAQVSQSTVQRARRVLKALGLVVELVAGRSILTRSERLEAWRRGSSHRKVAAEFALCSRRASGPRSGSQRLGGCLAMRAPRLGKGTGPVGARPRSVERDHPPGAYRVSTYLQSRSSHHQATTETMRAAPRPAHIEKVSRRTGRRFDPRSRRLAETVSGRLAWLRDVPVARLAPALHRFAQADWTAKDVDLGIRDVLTRRGHRVPPDLRQPAAYLANLLRDLEPADRPGALEAQRVAEERAQSAYLRLLAYGPPCPHGRPAGDVPSPLRGDLACPLCRAAATAWPTPTVTR